MSPIPPPAGKGNPPSRVSNCDRIHRRLARPAGLDRSMLVMAAFAVEGGGGGGALEGRVSAGPAKQSPHCLAE